MPWADLGGGPGGHVTPPLSLDPKIFSKQKMAVSSIYGIERAMNQL